jgi:hypothetical protein
MSGERQWRWDGTEWTYWDGAQWVVGQPAPEEIPSTAAAATDTTTPTSPNPPLPSAAAPEPHAAAAGAATTATNTTSTRKFSGSAIAAIILGSLLAVVVLGGGALWAATNLFGTDDDVVTLRTEPINTAVDAFTSSVGTDTAVTANQGQGIRTVPAQTPGLYGGTLNNATCDKDQLVAFLQADPAKGAAWAAVFGIPPAQIPAFVAGLTPVVLTADTAVTNHGFVNGQANPVPAVLQAGTAVMVNEFGEPVVKCYCGNPLLPPPALNQVRYTGPTWATFNANSVTVVQASSTVITNFTIVNVVNGDTIIRPAGTSGGSDSVPGAVTPAPATPTPTAPTPTPSPTTPPPPVESGREGAAIGLVTDRLDQCQIVILGPGTDYVPVAQDPQFSFSALPTGAGPGLYLVTVAVDTGEVYTFTANVDTGSVVPADPLAADIAARCSGVFD